MAELWKIMLAYLNENLGITFIGICLILSIIIYVAYRVSSYIIALNKQQNPDTFICHRHEDSLNEHGDMLKHHSEQFRSINEAIQWIQQGIDSIDKSIAVMTNGDIVKILWKKAERSFIYLGNKELQQLVMFKVRSFIEFVDLASQDIANEELSPDEKLVTVQTSLELGAKQVSIFFSKCGKTDFYEAFNERHTQAVEKYSSLIESIILDPINNHKQRFVDASITFMHEFISLLIKTWMAYNYMSDISVDEDLIKTINLEELKP